MYNKVRDLRIIGSIFFCMSQMCTLGTYKNVHKVLQAHRCQYYVQKSSISIWCVDTEECMTSAYSFRYALNIVCLTKRAQTAANEFQRRQRIPAAGGYANALIQLEWMGKMHGLAYLLL